MGTILIVEATIMNCGYIRVSAKNQNEARQLAAMEKLDIPPGNLYIDKQSGKDFQRPAYRRMLRRLRCGDVLYVMSIDRLGRNYDETLEQWCVITKQKQADIVVLEFPLLDTRDLLQLRQFYALQVDDCIARRCFSSSSSTHFFPYWYSF